MIHGLPDDWNQTDDGHETIYTLDPNVIAFSKAARVIYELRLDVARLNDEVVAGRDVNAELINDYKEYVVNDINLTSPRPPLSFRQWADNPVLADQELVAAARAQGFLWLR
jgi:hypothetical protein